MLSNFFFKKVIVTIFNYMHKCAHACECSVIGVQKRESDPEEGTGVTGASEPSVWVLGTKLKTMLPQDR